MSSLPINRRHLLKSLSAPLFLSALPFSTALAKTEPLSRKLSFYHIHSEKWASFTYWEEGQYLPDALLEINWYLRDYRNNTAASIDKHLLDQLTVLQHLTGSNKAYEVISAYRSPETNKILTDTTDGVAENSLHMQGRAIDVRLHGVELKNLHKAALSLNAGGVGHYPDSNFVHLDSGIIQNWDTSPPMTHSQLQKKKT